MKTRRFTAFALFTSIALLTLPLLAGLTPATAQVTGTTERVSVASDGTQGNWNSYYPSISADGRYVAFDSEASNLVSGDTNHSRDIFVHDRQTGQTTRVSVASDGTQGSSGSYDPSISADGRYVAFESGASNLVSGDTNGAGDVFVRDREDGVSFDFQVEDVWWSPDPPVAMSDSTINVRVRNVGPATYVPNTGDYVIGIKLTDTDKDPDEYWYYRSPGSGVGTLQPNEDRTFQVPKFWFTRPQVDQIEVTFFPTDNDSNTANNVRTETITIQPASDSLLDCLSLALDVVTVYAATHGVDIPVLEAITVNFMLTCAKVEEALSIFT